MSAGGYVPIPTPDDDSVPDGYADRAHDASNRLVVGVGAICGHRSGDVRARTASFWVGEFIELDDGQRIVLHRDRGFTIGGGSAPSLDLTADIIEECALSVVLPDEGESDDDHPWEFLARRARLKGVSVTPEELSQLSYVVELTPALQQWVIRASGR